jgi:GTP cyclohydrolase IA
MKIASARGGSHPPHNEDMAQAADPHPGIPQGDREIENDVVSMEALIRHQLILLGEDPLREGLRDTPERVKESLEFLTRGYHMTIDDVFGDAIFTETYKDMVVVKDIEMYSLCEHHLLPFFGRVHIGYIPKGRLVGLSKMPRLVELYSRRLQVQERMTRQIAECLHRHLEPVGVAVVIEADHLCMKMRGVEKQNSRVFTSCVLGIFQSDPKTRAEFMGLIKGVPNL